VLPKLGCPLHPGRFKPSAMHEEYFTPSFQYHVWLILSSLKFTKPKPHLSACS
jgi:hypothetical protein